MSAIAVVEKVLTVKEVAEALRVQPETVRVWLRSGRLHGMDLGGRVGWRIRESELERFMRASESDRT